MAEFYLGNVKGAPGKDADEVVVSPDPQEYFDELYGVKTTGATIETPSSMAIQLKNLVSRVSTEMLSLYNKMTKAVFSVNGIKPNSDGDIVITSIDSATKAAQDASGNNIEATYLKKTEKASSATTADTATVATKASQDASGNNIEATYAKKTDIPEVPEVDTSALVVKSGYRGALAGYEATTVITLPNMGDSITIDATSPDAMEVNFANTQSIQVSNGVEGTTWTKVVHMVMPQILISVYLGSSWNWSPSSMDIDPGTGSRGGFLILCWCGSKGMASYTQTYPEV